MARVTRIVDDRASARTCRAWSAEREQALVVVVYTGSATVGAASGSGAGLGSRARARRASGIARQMDDRCEPMDGIGEVQVKVGFEIDTSLATRTPRFASAPSASPEHAAQNVAEITHLVETSIESLAIATHTVEPTSDGPQMSDLVVGLSLLVVAEHVVSRRNLLETLLSCLVARVGIGVELTSGEVL